MTDDLNAPLGQEKKARRGMVLPAFIPKAVIGLLALSLISFGLWAAVFNDPLGGEPSASITVEPGTATTKMAEAVQPPIKVETAPRIDGPLPGSKTVTIIDGSSGKREEITIPAAPASPRVNVAAAPGESGTGDPKPSLVET